MVFTHVALVGLMGSGKSAVGALIAEHLDLPLVDVDEEITARTGKSVRALWEEGGEDAYRPLERSIVVESLEPGRGRVLAAPGGIVVDLAALDAVSQRHIAVVYLRAEPETLAQRIVEDDQPRPLLGADPLSALRAMHDERNRRYQAIADLILDVEDRTPQQLAQRVLDVFGADFEPARAQTSPTA